MNISKNVVQPQVEAFSQLYFMFYSAGWMASMLLAARVLGGSRTSSSVDEATIILIVGILATGYTAMGGVKAVIWTDTIQAFAGGGMVFALAAW